MQVKDVFFELDFVFVPVHLTAHWCMGGINFRDKKLEKVSHV